MMTPREYIALCKTHFAKHWWKYSLPVLVLWFAQIWVRLDFNYTNSLPDHVYLTVKGDKNVTRGDFVAFAFPTEHPHSPYRKGTHFLKIVAGLPGDKVHVDAYGNVHIVYREEENDIRNIFLLDGGHFVGKAKRHSKTGKPLDAFKGGVIPSGYIYVAAPHPDSLDSRYAMLGLVSINKVSKSYSLF
jgi:conjugal transfer pilin signal peptidase TrbI